MYLFNAKRAEPDEFKNMGEPFQQNGVPIEILLACDGESEFYLNGELLVRLPAVSQGIVYPVHARVGKNELAVRVRNDKDSGMMIGLIRTAGGIVSLLSDKCAAVACDDDALKKYLADQSSAVGEPVAMKIVGNLGIAPHFYMTGDYLGTGARWVWPDTTGKDAKTAYLVRWQFEIGK